MANARVLRGSLGALIGAYLLLAGFYGRINLPGNAPDEPSHVAYARYWAETGELPAFERSPYWPRYTAFHPPLYYALLRVALKAFGEAPAGDLFRRFRLVSTLLHGLGLLAVWGIAARLIPGRPDAAFAAAAALALNPMYCFIGASVINDPLANLCAALALWTAVRLAQDPPDLPTVAAFGAALGAGALAKMSTVMPGAAAAGFLLFRRRLTAAQWSVVLLLVSLTAGPIFFRNWSLYGDPLAAGAIYATEPMKAGIGGLFHWARSSFESSWAFFGWMLVRVPGFYYAAAAVLVAAAAAGAGMAWRKGNFFEPRAAALLSGVAAVVLAQGAWYGVTSLQAQGRYLFVGLGAFVPLLWGGLQFHLDRLPRSGRRAAVAVLLVFAAALQWVSLSRIAACDFVVPGVYNPKGI